MNIYFDFRDWWIGYYRGPNHHYVCLLPTVVIRWKRKATRILDAAYKKAQPEVYRAINYMVQARCPPDRAYFVPDKKIDIAGLMQAYKPASEPGTIFLHPNTKKYLEEIARLDINKDVTD